MPAPTRNIDFLNHNAIRRCPLSGDATCIDVSESFEIPNDFIVGLDVPVAAGIDVSPEKFFIRRVSAFGSGYMVTVGYDSVDGAVDVATALIPRVSHTKYKTYNLGGVGDFDETFGKITIGDLANIDEQSAGIWEFSLQGGRIDPDAVRPQLRGVSGLYVQNGQDLVGPLTGYVVLKAGQNFQFNVAQVGDADPEVTFNAIEGEGTVEACLCEGEEEATPIYSINLVRPDAAGNISLVGDNCIGVEAASFGLRLTDSCCQPCCSCDELTAITTELVDFSKRMGTLEALWEKLEAATAGYGTLLGVKLGDRGCEVC